MAVVPLLLLAASKRRRGGTGRQKALPGQRLRLLTRQLRRPATSVRHVRRQQLAALVARGEDGREESNKPYVSEAKRPCDGERRPVSCEVPCIETHQLRRHALVAARPSAAAAPRSRHLGQLRHRCWAALKQRRLVSPGDLAAHTAQASRVEMRVAAPAMPQGASRPWKGLQIRLPRHALRCAVARTVCHAVDAVDASPCVAGAAGAAGALHGALCRDACWGLYGRAPAVYTGAFARWAESRS